MPPKEWYADQFNQTSPLTSPNKGVFIPEPERPL
jgi:hypothetical protein